MRERGRKNRTSATMLAGWKKSSRIDACTYRVYQQHRSTTAGGSIGKAGSISGLLWQR